MTASSAFAGILADSFQKLLHHPYHLPRTLQVHRVAGALHHTQLGARQHRLHLPRDPHVLLVQRSAHQQHPHVRQFRQPLVQRRCRAGAESAQRVRESTRTVGEPLRTQRFAHRLRLRSLAVPERKPLPPIHERFHPVALDVPRQRLVRRPARRTLGVVRDSGRAALENQRTHSLRRRQRCVQRHARTHGIAEQRRASNAECVEQFDYILRHAMRGVARRVVGRVGAAVSGERERYRLAPRCKRGEELVPRSRRACETVQQDQRQRGARPGYRRISRAPHDFVADAVARRDLPRFRHRRSRDAHSSSAIPARTAAQSARCRSTFSTRSVRTSMMSRPCAPSAAASDAWNAAQPSGLV